MTDKDLRQALMLAYHDCCRLIDDAASYSKHLGLSHQEGKRLLDQHNQALEAAIQGQIAAREEVISFYASLLQSLRSSEWLSHLLEPPHGPWLLLEVVLAQDKLESLLGGLEDRAFIDGQDLHDMVQRHDVMEPFHEDPRRALRLIATMLYAQENGQDVLDGLQYAFVEEIGATRPDYVYLVYRGRKIRLKGLSFPSRNALYRAQKKATSLARPQFDYNRPAVTVDKKSGTRVTVAGYLATPDADALYFNERIFRLKNITLETLRDKYHTIDGPIYELLCINQRSKGSFLVTGAEMGIGKTTFLQSLIQKIPDYWGIGIMDTENELNVQNNYPEKNIITVIENPHLSIEEGFRYLLKTARDVMVVGEITRKEEMENLIQGAIRLNVGIGGTLHAACASMGINCCAQLLKGEGQVLSAQENLARSLDLIIHLARHPQQKERIVVEEIVEIKARQIDYESLSEADLQKEVWLQRLDPRPYRIRSLVHYDFIRDCFVYDKLPSDAYLQKRAAYLDKTSIESLRKTWAALC